MLLLSSFPSGDGLELWLFFVAAGLACMIAAIQEQGWKRAGFAIASATFCLIAFFWPFAQRNLPKVTLTLRTSGIPFSVSAGVILGGTAGYYLGLFRSKKQFATEAPLVSLQDRAKLLSDEALRVARAINKILSRYPRPTITDPDFDINGDLWRRNKIASENRLVSDYVAECHSDAIHVITLAKGFLDLGGFDEYSLTREPTAYQIPHMANAMAMISAEALKLFYASAEV